MLSPKYQRYAERLGELVDEGNKVAALEKPSAVGAYIQDEDKAALHAWLAKVHNIIATIFGEHGPYYIQLVGLAKRGVEHSNEVYPIVGLLRGALSDLENGFLLGQEFLIAGEIFDSVLQQAKHLTVSGYKDAAAVLARVVLEDALQRISRSEGLDATLNAARLNDALKQKGRYPQPQWRQVLAWLDIGNAAAHGKFDEYDQAAVERLLDDVERFLATELHN
jgi:hypothetical protein